MSPSDLKHSIARLNVEVQKAFNGKVPWKDIWANIKGVTEEFRATSFQDVTVRQELWEQFQSIVEAVKDQQDRARERREELARSSPRHLRHIMALAEASADSDDTIVRLIGFVGSMGLSEVVLAGLDALMGKIDEAKYRLEQRSATLRSGWQYLSENKSEMFGSDRYAAHARLTEAKDALDHDWSEWKEQKQLAWQARNEMRIERERQYQEKQKRWREGQEAFIGRLRDALGRLELARDSRESHLQSLNEQLSSAWSDGYRARVEEWIDNEERNIRDIEEKIRAVSDKIDEARSKLW
jgi:hypothetical protein